MNRSRTVRIIRLAGGAAIAGALAAAGAPAAAPSPQDAVSLRQAGFKKMAAAMKVLKEQLGSDAPAKDAMVAAAETIATAAREQAKLFPAGSGPAADVKTDALPDIWADRAEFDGQMARLIAESGKLVATASDGDAAAIGAQVKATGAVCGGCHRQFRAES